jgi:simple sugar transport system ATP-binding protein
VTAKVQNLLEMRGICKTFPGVVANDEIDFEVKPGEIHALLGENGAGKTTLMRILYGLYEPDGGAILLRGESVHIGSPQDAIALGIGMVHQEFMLVPTFTVAENVALGLGRTTEQLRLAPLKQRINELAASHGLAVDPDARIEHLSIGVQQRVEIVKLLCRNASLLIMDEPTAVLTPQETEGLFENLSSLAGEGHSVIFITHKLDEVMAVSDRVTVLRSGKVVGTQMVGATSPRELAEMMVGREVLFALEKPPLSPGEPVLQVENLHALDDRGLPALRGVSLDVRQCEIVGIAGVDGNGQPQLAEALAGLRKVHSGRITIAGSDVTRQPPAKRYAKGMAYVPADRRGVGTVSTQDLCCNCILGQCEEFSTGGGWVLSRPKILQHAARVVSTFDVRTPGTDLVAGKLSGGNLQKLLLGRELMRQPKLLVVEQPTRGLDVGATEYVRARILEARQGGSAVLLISSELEEILELSDRIAVMYEGQIMGMLPNEDPDIRLIGLMMAGSHRQTTENTTSGEIIG